MSLPAAELPAAELPAVLRHFKRLNSKCWETTYIGTGGLLDN